MCAIGGVDRFYPLIRCGLVGGWVGGWVVCGWGCVWAGEWVGEWVGAQGFVCVDGCVGAWVGACVGSFATLQRCQPLWICLDLFCYVYILSAAA